MEGVRAVGAQNSRDTTARVPPLIKAKQISRCSKIDSGRRMTCYVPRAQIMKRTFVLLILSLIGIAVARAGDVKVEATMMTEPHGREITAYTADAPRLYAIFKSKGSSEGDNVRCVWIADDVGDAAAKGTKIEEKTITAKGDMEGEFSLSKPTPGWPLGKYHIEIYVNEELATKVNFEIKAAPKSTKQTDEEEEESGD